MEHLRDQIAGSIPASEYARGTHPSFQMNCRPEDPDIVKKPKEPKQPKNIVKKPKDPDTAKITVVMSQNGVLQSMIPNNSA